MMDGLADMASGALDPMNWVEAYANYGDILFTDSSDNLKEVVRATLTGLADSAPAIGQMIADNAPAAADALAAELPAIGREIAAAAPEIAQGIAEDMNETVEHLDEIFEALGEPYFTAGTEVVDGPDCTMQC